MQLLKILGKDLFQVSLLASGSFLACGSIISGAHGILSIHVCVQMSSLDKDTSHIGLGACQFQYDLNLINYMGRQQPYFQIRSYFEG